MNKVIAEFLKVCNDDEWNTAASGQTGNLTNPRGT